MVKKCKICYQDFETGKHKQKINCSKECLSIHMNNIKADRLQKSRDGMIKKHGVDHPSKLIGFSDLVKKTKKDRYGDENYNNRDKSKETLLGLYGVENVMQLDETRDLSKKTKKDRHGDENFNNREKSKKTIKEKFGVDHHLQLKEIFNKQIKTNKEKNGVEFNVLSEISKKNKFKVMNDKYGSDYYFSSIEYLKETREEKILRLKEILNKRNLFVSDKFEDEYDKIRDVDDDGKITYKKYEIECKSCRSIFKSRVVSTALICRKCYPIESGSIIQREMRDFLISLNINFTENDRVIIKPHELDFYIENNSLAIELNGNYYHSELSGNKSKQYHVLKTEKCENKKVKLIHVFEDEWILKKDIVKSRIKNNLGFTENKKFARKCEIREVNFFDKKLFLNSNHIQGNCVDKIRIGLYDNEELISLITFGKPRLALGIKQGVEKNNDCYELIRFCSKTNTSIVGGFDKLLKCFIKKYNPKKIVTYADCRWSGSNHENSVYAKVGFKFVKITPPSYYYLKVGDYLTRKHRFSLNKIKLLEVYGGDKNKTGFELAIENGYDRIWDCGAMSFEMIL